MPRRCCVPGFKSNYDLYNVIDYDPNLKNGGSPVSTFAFPRDEDLRRLWIKAIPRADGTPSKGSFVCSEHFSVDEIIRTENITNKDCSCKVVLLQNPKLIVSAVPHIFPNLPQYLSKTKNLRADPSERRQNYDERFNDLCKKFMDQDLLKGFSELVSKLKSVEKL